MPVLKFTMPYNQIVEEHLSDNGCEDHVDREYIKLFAKENNESEMTTRKGSKATNLTMRNTNIIQN